MASWRVVGADRLVKIMEAERGEPVTPVDLGFLLYGGDALTADIAADLIRACAAKKPPRD